MKIGILVDRFPQRSETFVWEHAVGLAERGHEVTVISQAPKAEILPEEIESIRERNVKCIHVETFGEKGLGGCMRFLLATVRTPCLIRYLFPSGPWRRSQLFSAGVRLRILDRIKPDVVHVHFGALAARLEYLRQTGKWVITWHGYDVNRLPGELGEDIYRDLFSRPVYHTVNSRFLKSGLERLGANSRKISIIPMGIDLKKFQCRRDWAPERTILKVLSVGRLHELKGHRYLIEAMALLRSEGISVQLTIIGEGELHDALNRRIAELSLGDVVRLSGAKPPSEVVSEMQAADLFALTGVPVEFGAVESQGVAYAEAQATGLPVIGSDIGGVPESLVHGETGFLCPPGDSKAIAEAIRFFVNDRSHLEVFGRRAREFVESKFSVSAMLDSFEEIYSKIGVVKCHRILSVVSQLTGGGAERNLVRISNLLAQKGVKVDLLVLRDSENEDIQPDSNVAVHHLGLNRDSPMPAHLIETAKNLLLLRKTFVRLHPDKILSFCYRTNLLCLEAALGTGIPVVVSERSNPIWEEVNPIHRIRRRVWYPQADKVVLLAEELRDWASRMWPEWNHCAIPNFVPEPPISNARMGSPRKRKTILAVGRFVYAKGFDTLLEIFAELASEFPEWDLEVVGDGPERQKLMTLTEQKGLSERVRFPGWRTDVYAFYRSADVFAFSSRFEGFGMTLAEALSCGLPAVAFDCPHGPSRMIEDGVNGFLVDEGDGDLFRERLRELMEKDSLRERMGMEARSITRKFGVDPIMRQWESVLLTS